MPSSSSSYHHHLFNSRSRRHGYSKAQLCFFKILHTISSVPPPHRSAQQHSSRTGGIAVDLNLRFCSVAEDDAEFRDSDENGSDSSAIEAIFGGGEKSAETKIEEERGVEENEYNCLDLLIEAAKVISGKEESEIEERRRRSDEAKERWMVVNLFSDGDYLAVKSPAAAARTTKRGRSQALPYRFRDSVVEPLKRRGRPYKRLIGSS